MPIARPIGTLGAAFMLLAVAAMPSGAQQAPRQRTQTAPLVRANLDTTCAPCTNFYQFANGGWIARNPIPPAYSQWGSFNELADHNTEELRGVLEDAAANRAAGASPDVRKLGEFYASCMDTVAIERAGAAPIRPELARIAALRTPADLRRYVIDRQGAGVGLLFGFGSRQDARNSSEVIGGIRQGGLGLPDRDYYLRDDPRTVALRKAYQRHVANDLILAGETRDAAVRDAASILALETALARASLTRVQQRDPHLTYNRKTPAELATLAPGFDWPAFFAAQHVPATTPVTVQNPHFLTTADSMLGATPVPIWRAYFRWMLVRRAAPMLSRAFVDEDFAFTRELTGAREQLPRYKKCIRAADGEMGEALGQAYVKKYFTPEAKARALEMVNNLKAAFRERLETREWMSDSTRAMALAKLEAFAQKIGYPDRWRSYATMAVRPGNSFYANVMAATAYANADDNARIGKPVDRTRWGMTTPTVNAYYNPPMNEIVFPAGILQPPFFDPRADDAVNYGGMGAVIGHEMTHGFDDQGSQYDAHGNLRQWFTDSDLKNFRARTTAYAEQFDRHTILDSVHVNGKLTNGENIADLGGLTIAYAALEKALAGKPRPLIDGFTPEQRFFLAWAQIWRNNITPEAARLRIATDPHSPGIWRTNGPLANMPEFAKAWGCKAGDRMVLPPDQRVAIW